MSSAHLQFALVCAPFVVMLLFSVYMAVRCGFDDRAETKERAEERTARSRSASADRHGDRISLILTPGYVPPPPAEVMAAWDEACQVAFATGQKPVINLPHGLIDSRIKSLRNVMTGQWVDINWLPADRFPTDLPAQYFNPDLILPEVT